MVLDAERVEVLGSIPPSVLLEVLEAFMTLDKLLELGVVEGTGPLLETILVVDCERLLVLGGADVPDMMLVSERLEVAEIALDLSVVNVSCHLVYIFNLPHSRREAFIDGILLTSLTICRTTARQNTECRPTIRLNAAC